jgi:hypothetical protein
MQLTKPASVIPTSFIWFTLSTLSFISDMMYLYLTVIDYLDHKRGRKPEYVNE